MCPDESDRQVTIWFHYYLKIVQTCHNEDEQAKVIPKSRYDSIDSFLSNCCNKWDGYNDIEVG